ncbi:MAG TPA: hypothetical protein VGL81_02340 [Polyangiaceae bacterium]|jgi:DNA-directed RNA polymerase specialized sigma24 family protein
MTQAAPSVLDPRDVLIADEATAKPFISKRLLRFCFARSRDVHRAKDLASEAVTLTLAGEGWHRWVHDGRSDPATSLLMHLFNIAKDVLKKERERAATWREVEGNEERDAAAPDSKPPLGETPAKWTAHEKELSLADQVMERLDEDARRMLRAESESEEKLDQRALAQKLGWTLKQVMSARERVFYHRDVVLAQARKKGGAS